MNKKGHIIRIISNLYTIETEDDKIYECRARGKFRKDEVSPLVGDFVVIDTENAYILEILPRKNELTRPKIANVDVALIMTSVKDPNLSLNLLDKELLVVSASSIEPIICLTKTDLLNIDEEKEIDSIFKYYKKIGYKVFKNTELTALKKYLNGKTAVLTGQTGAGKSTLLNKLDSTLELKTSPISKALGRGVHTTRHVELFKIGKTLIADTPGFSALDLNFDKETLANLYPEFKDHTCKFDNCSHDKENVCGVKDAYNDGIIMATRYENYLKFRSEIQ